MRGSQVQILYGPHVLRQTKSCTGNQLLLLGRRIYCKLMQIPLIVWLSSIVAFAAVIYKLPDFNDAAQFTSWATLSVLAATLVTLVWYAYDTHRIAQQTVESNLRPIVLVQGVLNWSTLSYTASAGGIIHGPPIEFQVLNHTALNFRGYIVNANQRHDLIFGNAVSTKVSTTTPMPMTTYLKTWGWVPPNNYLNAVYDPTIPGTSTTGDNGIFIEYFDTEGNIYHTVVDSDYSQQVKRGQIPI